MALTRAQVRELDRRAIEEYGVPGVVLMENAGRGVVEVLLRLGARGPVHVVCGKGNNGGDGFVVARHLDLHGVPATIHRCCGEAELAGDALVNYRIAARGGLRLAAHAGPDDLTAALDRAEWVVDALLGTGLTGAVRPPFDAIIRCINTSPARVLAVDLPSGLDADTGEPLGETVEADQTVTFVAPKAGFTNPAAARHLGTVHVAHIGAPRALLEQFGVG